MTTLGSFRLLFWLTQIVNVCVGVIVCVWVIQYKGGLAWSPNYTLQFNWHIIALTVGLVNVTALETLLFRSVRWLTWVRVKQVHALLAAVSVILVAVGYWAVFEPHIVQKKINFSSLHSWIGTFTVVLYLLQTLVGTVAYLWPGLSLKFRTPYTPLHVFFGLSVFVMGTVSCLLGLLEEVKKLPKLGGQAITLLICGILMVVLTMLGVYIDTRPEYRRSALAQSAKLAKSSTGSA